MERADCDTWLQKQIKETKLALTLVTMPTTSIDINVSIAVILAVGRGNKRSTGICTYKGKCGDHC